MGIPANVGAAFPGGPDTGTDTSYATYRWLLAWVVVLTLLWVLTKTQLGYVAVYYALLLILLFLFVTNASAIQYALAPLSTAQGSVITSATA